jgi:hypothetical protein
MPNESCRARSPISTSRLGWSSPRIHDSSWIAIASRLTLAISLVSIRLYGRRAAFGLPQDRQVDARLGAPPSPPTGGRHPARVSRPRRGDGPGPPRLGGRDTGRDTNSRRSAWLVCSLRIRTTPEFLVAAVGDGDAELCRRGLGVGFPSSPPAADQQKYSAEPRISGNARAPRAPWSARPPGQHLATPVWRAILICSLSPSAPVGMPVTRPAPAPGASRRARPVASRVRSNVRGGPRRGPSTASGR